MCGPRCILRTHDENIAYEYYKSLLKWAKSNREWLLKKIEVEFDEQNKDFSFLKEALKSDENIDVYFGDGSSTTSFFMVLAAYEKNECYVISEETWGSILVNVKGVGNRMFRGGGGHWVEVV